MSAAHDPAVIAARAHSAEETLRHEYDLLGRGHPPADQIAAVRRAAGERPTEGGAPCPACARMRSLVERLVATGVDWLDDADAASADLEDDEREVISEDDGEVSAQVLAMPMRGGSA